MKKLKAAFIKGYLIFVVGAIVIVMFIGEVLSYLELEIFNGKLPDEYRIAAVLLMLFLLLLLAVPTMVKPAKAINIEKERRVNKWHVTGVRPEDQEMDDKK